MFHRLPQSEILDSRGNKGQWYIIERSFSIAAPARQRAIKITRPRSDAISSSSRSPEEPKALIAAMLIHEPTTIFVSRAASSNAIRKWAIKESHDTLLIQVDVKDLVQQCDIMKPLAKKEFPRQLRESIVREEKLTEKPSDMLPEAKDCKPALRKTRVIEPSSSKR